VTTHTWTSLPAADAPSARTGHTAVWTGTEMIIWGGTGSDGSRLNTGARYSLATHSWRPLPSAGAPSARSGHSAAWTGTEMIIWGGAGPGEAAVDSGARYDPGSNTWVPMNSSGAPGPRFGHTAVWTGDEMVIWGGAKVADASCVAAGHYCVMGDGAHYSPATDTWLPASTSGAAEARFDHTVVWTGTEMVVWGGRTSATWVVGTGARYHPVTRVWTELASENAPSARMEHTAVWTGSDMIIWGGGDGVIGSSADPRSQGLATGARYAPATNSWSPVNTLNAPTPRRAHSAVWTGQAMMVCGGWDVWRSVRPAVEDCRSYLAAKNTWGGSPTVPQDLSGNTSVWTGNEVLVSGEGTTWNTATDAVWRYLPDQRTWAPVPVGGGPAGRKRASTIWTGTEMITWGGVNFIDDPRHPSWTCFDDGGRFSPSTGTWTLIPATDLLDPRMNHSAVWTGTEMIVWGGNVLPAIGSVTYNDGARYSPATRSWQPLPSTGAPSPRAEHLGVWTGTEMIVWGGTDPSGARYRPASNTWSPMTSMAGPPDQWFYRGVWTGTELVVLSLAGDRAAPAVVGGRYSPATDSWSPMNLTGAPVHTSGGFAVWTGHEMIVWGWSAEGNSNLPSGARYSPATDTWTPMTSTGSPTTGTSAVWDGARMIVFGDTGAVGASFYTPNADADLDVVQTTHENGTLAITFSSTLGSSYTLWQTDALTSGDWTNTGLPALSGTGSPLTFSIPAPAAAGRFFRVQAGP
jgi:N-acetylneuraminic acid mutarotase